MVQRYLPEVRKGDKRIILVDGEPVAGLNRVPPEGEARSNMHVGGRPELSRADRRASARSAPRIGPALKERDMIFVGIDVIGDYLTEINVTSPDRHPRDQALRRPRHRADDLGRDREAESGMRSRAALLDGAALPEGVPVCRYASTRS